MKKRKTIGLLINDIDGSFQTLMVISFKQAAEEMDCDLIVFAGRALRSKEYSSNQHHIIYSFIENGELDGIIIISATIGAFVTTDEFKKFCRKYIDIPIVSFGVEIPNATSIFCECKESMKDLMRHLIDDHGYRKIIFVTGPDKDDASIERFEAYMEVFEEKSMAFDEKLVFHGDFTADTGYRIMKEIVFSNIEYDAIAFANDDMAIGAINFMENLKKMGSYPMSKKLIICGFDDSINASNVNLPLTTVKQPITKMCNRAVELVINGEVKEELIAFKPIVVKRASCGCSYKKNDNEQNNNSVKLVVNYRVHENLQTYSIDELFDKLTPVLKECFIESCFIMKYVEGPIFYDGEMAFDESYTVPERSEMIYAYFNGQRKGIDQSNKIIKTADILPKCYLTDDRRYTYVVMPLFFRNEHFGYICFEATNNDPMTYELLRGEISNTLKGALMIMEREQIEETLRENERLASLGQLIGGISHNLMTPIMSIAGIASALEELNNEYHESIEDKSVTNEDHYEIGSEMLDWAKKLKEYNAYMSNVISAVKSKAVQLNSRTNNSFTIDELINRIKFMKSTGIMIKESSVELYVDAKLNIVIPGDITNIIQVLENLIKNSIESYDKEELHECRVEVYIRENKNRIVIEVKDFGCGITNDIKSRIFKSMVTTKGKNGTGLSLLLSYSTIKGKFEGDIWFKSEKNKGSAFYIAVPIS